MFGQTAAQPFVGGIGGIEGLQDCSADLRHAAVTHRLDGDPRRDAVAVRDVVSDKLPGEGIPHDPAFAVGRQVDVAERPGKEQPAGAVPHPLPGELFAVAVGPFGPLGAEKRSKGLECPVGKIAVERRTVHAGGCLALRGSGSREIRSLHQKVRFRNRFRPKIRKRADPEKFPDPLRKRTVEENRPLVKFRYRTTNSADEPDRVILPSCSAVM